MNKMNGEEEETTFMDSEGDEEQQQTKDLNFAISAFPETVNFVPTFQGVFSHFTLFIVNPFSIQQKIDISLDPSSPFSIASNELTLNPGVVYSLIITFISDEFGKFETDLVIHTSMNTITVPLYAQCLSSPLLFDEYEITSTQFSMAKTSVCMNIANRSLLKSLHVLFDFDSASFSITPPSVDLPPFSICPIEIKYDPNMSVDCSTVPHFHIQCSESGDSISIPLAIARPNTSGLIEFGVLPIGVRYFKQIHVDDKSYLCFTKRNNIKSNNNKRNYNDYSDDDEEEDDDDVPELSLPFSYQILNKESGNDNKDDEEEEFVYNDEDEENIIIFSFISEKTGEFYDNIQFGPLKFQLHAIAVKPPFTIQPSGDSSVQMIFTNTSNIKRSYMVSFDKMFERKNSLKFALQPNESRKIDTSGKHKDSLIFIQWKENDQKVTQELILPSSDIELDEDSLSFELNYGQKKKKSVNIKNKSEKNMEVQLVTDSPEFSLQNKTVILKPHANQKVDIEFNPKSPQKIQGILQVKTNNSNKGNSSTNSLVDSNNKNKQNGVIIENNVKKVPLKTLSAILSSTNLVHFLRAEDNSEGFVVSFCGPKKVIINKPDWIDCPEEAVSAEPVKLNCKKLPDSVCGGYLKLEGKNSHPSSIPIIAYHSCSDISIHIVRPYVLRVENHGLRTAFVTFSAVSKDDIFEVNPIGGFIPFNRSLTFRFSPISEDSRNDDDFTQNIYVHWGDEVMRQILSYLDPESYYSTIFENIDILRNEISSIPDDILDDIDLSTFKALFNQILTKQKVCINKVNNDLFTLSSQKIDFGEVGIFQTKEIKIWIENQKLNPISLDVSSLNHSSLRFPTKINLKGEQRYLLKISVLSSKEQEIDDCIFIQSTDQKNSFEKKINIKGFIVDTTIKFVADVLNFGVCEVGRINRGQLRLYNKKKEKTVIKVSASQPFSCPKKKFAIESGCYVLLPVHFTPLIESSFQGRILFEPEKSHRFYIPVLGSALYDPNKEY